MLPSLYLLGSELYWIFDYGETDKLYNKVQKSYEHFIENYKDSKYHSLVTKKVVNNEDGGKTVTTTTEVTDANGNKTTTVVTNTYDSAGNLISGDLKTGLPEDQEELQVPENDDEIEIPESTTTTTTATTTATFDPAKPFSKDSMANIKANDNREVEFDENTNKYTITYSADVENDEFGKHNEDDELVLIFNDDGTLKQMTVTTADYVETSYEYTDGNLAKTTETKDNEDGDGVIETITEYKDGVKTKETVTEYDIDDEITQRTIKTYYDDESYTQTIITPDDEGEYTKTTIKYDKDGNQIETVEENVPCDEDGNKL